MAILFALLAFAGWGVGDIFGALSARRIGSIYTFFWMAIFSLVILSFYIPFAGPIASIPMFIFAFLLNMIDFYGTVVYLKALTIGNASLVGTIAGSFGFVSAILSIIILGESINLMQGLGILLAVVGVILASFKFEDVKNKNVGKMLAEPSIKYAFIALISWGLYYAFLRIPVKSIGWFWTQYSWNFLFIAFILLGKVKKDVVHVLTNRGHLLFVLLYTLIISVGIFSYNLGITYGFTSVVAPIAGSSTVLFVILSRIIFKEKLTTQQKIGICSSLLGIIILSFSSI